MKQLIAFIFMMMGLFIPIIAQQEWELKMLDPNATFFTIREEMNTKFAIEKAQKSSDVDEDYGIYEEDELENKFKRWEWYWSNRVHADGTFPTPKERKEQFDIYQQNLAAFTQNKSMENLVVPAWSNISRTSNDGGYWGMGRTSSIAYHPTDANTFWVTAEKGGIWKTTNGGTTYTPIGDNLPYLGAGSIVVDYANVNNIYICTGAAEGQISTGIYKSTNGGTSWSPSLAFNLSSQISIYNLVQHPTVSTTLLAATSNGLYRTTDSGATWTNINTWSFTDVEYKLNNGNIVYAARDNSNTAATIYKSTDGGTTFTQVKAITKADWWNQTRLIVSKSNNNKVLAFCQNTAVWTSDDSGATWTTKTMPPESPNCMVLSPSNATTMYAGNVDVYKSTDNGSSWTKISNWYNDGVLPEVHADHRGMSYNPVNNKIYSMNDGGVDEYTESTATWKKISNGLIIQQFYSVACAANNINVLGLGSQDNGGSRRNSNGTWMNTNGGDAGTQAIDPTDANICYSNYNPDPYIIRTLDGWASSTDLAPNVTDLTSWWEIPYVLQESNPSMITAGYHAVYRSTNKGNTWTKISTDFTTVGDYWGAIREIAVAPSNANYIYAATETTLYRTSNGGTTWSTVSKNNISGIEVKPDDPNVVYICYGGFNAATKVEKSTDAGATWTNISTGIPNVPTNDILFQKNTTETLYLATDFGVYYRTSSMSAWGVFGLNMPVVPVNGLAIHYASTNWLRAATYGRGIFEIGLVSETPCSTPPTNLVVTNISSTGATLSWTGVSGVTNYRLQYKLSTATTWTNTSPVATTGTSVTLTGLTTGATYNWRVRSYCSSTATYSSYATGASFVPASSNPCGTPPSGLANSNITNNSATVSWTAVSGVTNYRVQYKLSTATAWTNTNPAATTGTSVTLTGLTAGATYNWRIRSYCSSSATYSAYVNGPNIVTTNACAVSAVQSVTNITSQSATITWLNSGAPNYNLWVYDTEWHLIASNYVGTSYNVTGLTASTSYYIDVVANCASGGISTYPNYYTFSTVAPCEAAPTGLTVNSVSANSVTLAWTPITGVANYRVQYKLSTATTWTNTSPVATTGSLITIGGLAASATYNWRVRSYCSSTATYSAYSNGSNFTTNNSAVALQMPENETLNTFQNAIKLTVFPNPAKGEATIRYYNDDESQMGTIQVNDIFGRLIIQKEVNLNEGENNIELDINTLQNGNYFINMSTFGSHRSSTIKLTISKD